MARAKRQKVQIDMSDYTITSPNTLPTHAIRGLWLTAWHYARCIRKAEAAEHPNEANRLINMALYRVGQHLLDLALDALDERDATVINWPTKKGYHHDNTSTGITE